MRESVITKSSFKAVLAFITIAALCVAAFSPLFAAKTAVAEAWPDTYAVTYEYNMGFTPVAGSYTVVYDGKKYDSNIPASLGAVESKEPGMRFAGFEIDGESVATFENDTFTVTSAKFFGTAGGTVRLTPVFEAIQYTINYSLGENPPAGADNPNTVTTYDVLDNPIALLAPQADGKTGYWTLNGEPISVINKSIIASLSGNQIDLVAEWADEEYTLTVLVEGEAPIVHTVTAGTLISACIGSFVPDAPAGLTFLGWAIDGEMIDINATVIAEDVTINAVFGTPSVSVSITLIIPQYSSTGTTTRIASVTTDEGTYDPEDLYNMYASRENLPGMIMSEAVWSADDTGENATSKRGDSDPRNIAANKSIANSITCTFTLVNYSITVQYFYDLDGDKVADDLNGDGVADRVAPNKTVTQSYNSEYMIESPVVDGLWTQSPHKSGTVKGNETITVFYNVAPEKQTAATGGVKGTVINNEGGLIDASVTVNWNTSAADAHKAKAEEMDRNSYGVLSVQITPWENAVYGVRGTYDITVDLGEDMKDVENYMVYKINDDGTYSPVGDVIATGSTLRLTTNSSGNYLVTGTHVVNYTLIYVLIALLILLVILLIVLLLVILLLRKKTVEFVTNGGEEVEKVKAKNGSIVELPVPEREGFVFAGWYLDEECTQPAPLEPDPDKDETPAAPAEEALEQAPAETPAEEAPAESAEAPAESAEAPEAAPEAPVEAPAKEGKKSKKKKKRRKGAAVIAEVVPAEELAAETPAEEVPAESVEAPAEEIPTEEVPAESVEAPAEETPTEETPAESVEAPAEETPAETPAENAETPAEEAPAEEEIRIFDEPGGKDVTDEQQGGGTTDAMSSKRARKAKNKNKFAADPVEEAPVESVEAPAEEVPAESAEAPAEEAPAESAEAPAEEVPAESAEAPAEEVSAESVEAPAEEVPAESVETPAEETPVEAPAEDMAAVAVVEKGKKDKKQKKEKKEKKSKGKKDKKGKEQEAPVSAEPAEPAEDKPFELPEVMRYKVVGNVKLYAKWVEIVPEEAHAVNFIAFGVKQCSVATMGKEQLVLPAAPAPQGYAFVRWYIIGKDGERREFTADHLAQKYLLDDLNVFADYVKVVPKVRFHACGVLQRSIAVQGICPIELPAAPELEEYRFCNWYVLKDGAQVPFTGRETAESYITSDIDVYAEYIKPVPVKEEIPPEPHTITFMADGEVVATVETAGRDALDLPAAPVKEGFVFRGWFTDEENHDTIVEESSFVDKDLEEDVTFYAFYEEEKEEEEEDVAAAAILPEEDEEEVEEEPEEDDAPEVEEKEEDEEEEEESDPDAPKLITAADTIKRRTSTMRGRLRYGSDVNKAIYEELVNHLLQYKNVTRSLTNRADNFKSKGSLLAKITLTGKTLKLYLPLDAKLYDYDKYHQLITEKNGYEEVPFTIKVKSNRGLKYAKELIDEAMAQKGVERKKKAGEKKSFKELILLQKGSLLIKAKKTDMLRSRVDSQDANAKLTDSEAQELVRIKYVPVSDEVKKTAFVGLDKIEELYNDCDMVNIKTLRKRGLVKEEHNRVKIIGGGTLTKSLKVYAEEYSLTAIKMIVLLGGKVVKLVEETVEKDAENK